MKCRLGLWGDPSPLSVSGPMTDSTGKSAISPGVQWGQCRRWYLIPFAGGGHSWTCKVTWLERNWVDWDSFNECVNPDRCWKDQALLWMPRARLVPWHPLRGPWVGGNIRSVVFWLWVCVEEKGCTISDLTGNAPPALSDSISNSARPSHTGSISPEVATLFLGNLPHLIQRKLFSMGCGEANSTRN